MVQKVLDTISESTHVVLLHHQLIWLYGNPELENDLATIPNGRLGECFWCINPNNFYQDIYPLLMEVESRGIEVLCIGGDIGFYAKTYHHQTPEGIDFLASGMNLEEEDNSVLLLSYDFSEKTLRWNFSLLKDL